MKYLLLVACLFFLVGSEASARTWYIKPDGTGDAPTIQAGIDSRMSGDTVLVAAGQYAENLLINATHNGVFVVSECGPEQTVITAAAPGTVADFVGVGRATVLEGFTLTGGTGAPNPEDPGSFHGGGIRAHYCSPSIIRNIITNNRVEPGRGGGIQCFGSSALVEGNIISDNFASYRGGGIDVEHGSPDIVGNILTGNSTSGGGTITAYYATISIVSNTIAGNEACINGGGIVVDNCDVVVENNIITGNHGHSIGGGAFLFACTGRLTGNTVVGNRAGSSAGLAFWGGCAPVACNNVVVGNTASGLGGIGCDETTGPTLRCNDVWGNIPTNYGGGCSDQTGINGNLSACPSFCNADMGDFHLCDGSPCASGNHPDGYDCGLIGALDVGCSCGPTSAKPTTWGAIKSMYR